MSLLKSENAWIPTVVKKARNFNEIKNKSHEELVTEELMKKVRSTLNKFTSDNIELLIPILLELRIDTVARLAKVVDFILEKAINEPTFAPFYPALCDNLKCIKVDFSNTTISFEMILDSKCDKLFELNENKELDTIKKLTEIYSCDDPEKKNDLLQKYNEYKKKIFLRPVEYFVFTFPTNPTITKLVKVLLGYAASAIKFVYVQLKFSTRKLEQYQNVQSVFESILRVHARNLIFRDRFMIMEIAEGFKSNWMSRKFEGENDEWKKNLQCKYIIEEYEQMHNIDDVIYLLMEDKNSLIRTRHYDFVKSVFQASFECKPSRLQIEAGKLLAELLSRKVISTDVVTQGIDAVLKNWKDYLIDYPHFISYTSTVIAPLLISNTALFEFENLKTAYMSLDPVNSSNFFIEVLQKILCSEETEMKSCNGGVLWIYNKWCASNFVPLYTFIPTNKINTHVTNDRLGIFILSIALYDKMKLTDSKTLCNEMQCWISKNIDEDIIKLPQLIRALTIAIFIHCSTNFNSCDDFFDRAHIELLTFYIQKRCYSLFKIIKLEVQCLYGIQIIATALKFHGDDIILKLFTKLYMDGVISKTAFIAWKEDNVEVTGFEEDQKTKFMALMTLNAFFTEFTVDSDE